MTIPTDLPAVAKALQDSESKEQFQRVLCVWLKLLFSMTSVEIALAIGWEPSSVRNIQARFKRKNVQCFVSKQKGGRKRENMSVDREARILDKFARRAKRGFVLDVDQIQKAYELSVGRTVPKSTVYRLIARHGLRHFLPRARRTG
jgi:hypothetical protein